MPRWSRTTGLAAPVITNDRLVRLAVDVGARRSDRVVRLATSRASGSSAWRGPRRQASPRSSSRLAGGLVRSGAERRRHRVGVSSPPESPSAGLGLAGPSRRPPQPRGGSAGRRLTGWQASVSRRLIAAGRRIRRRRRLHRSGSVVGVSSRGVSVADVSSPAAAGSAVGVSPVGGRLGVAAGGVSARRRRLGGVSPAPGRLGRRLTGGSWRVSSASAGGVSAGGVSPVWRRSSASHRSLGRTRRSS